MNKDEIPSQERPSTIKTTFVCANMGVYVTGVSVDGSTASAFFSLVNTVSTALWPPEHEYDCLEKRNSVHTGSSGSFIKRMFICLDGRDKCSLLPFDASSSVNITTVTDEGIREFLASGYGILRHLGFGNTGGRYGGSKNKNSNYTTVLHGVMNRKNFIERLLSDHGLKFSHNSFFPPVKYSTLTEEGEVLQVQIYPSSLAINLQNLTRETALKYGGQILRQITCEASIDTSLMRFCVDAEWRISRILSPYEKLQLVIAYYSFRWLENTEPEFDIVKEMHGFLQNGLQLFTEDYKRYWFLFERDKYKNFEIDCLFIEKTPLRKCPHAIYFRAFVLTFLTTQGHISAALNIRKTFPKDQTSIIERALNDPSLARVWYETHVLKRDCIYGSQ